MRRILFLVLVAAAIAGFATPSHAFDTPGKTTGSELALRPTGDTNIWDLTVESDQPYATALTGGFQMAVVNGLAYVSADPPCDNVTNVFCSGVPGDGMGTGVLGVLYIGISNLGAPFPANVGNPLLMGQVHTSGLPSFTTDGMAEVFGSTQSLLPEPVAFVQPAPPVPEPAAFVFVAMSLGSLALLRRRAA
jgi:hypothetical protein